MFFKRYIFETKSTRVKRILAKTLLWIIIPSILFISFSLLLPLIGRQENNLSETYFYKKSPDLIVVFTGDVGRISYAINKAEESDTTQAFISGVYAANTLKTFINSKELSEILMKKIEIDYLAQNTIGNVLYTLKYISTLKNISKVLLISSDYHIPRIKLLVNRYNTFSNIEFYYQATNTNYFSFKNFKIMLKETIKLINTLIFVIPSDIDESISTS